MKIINEKPETKDGHVNISESNGEYKVVVKAKHKTLLPEFTNDGILICPDSWESGWRD